MKLTFVISACCIALASAEKYVYKVSPRIVNGEEVIPHSVPYQVWIEFQSLLPSYHCGGVLISNNFVLTAGHCGKSAKSASVLLGAHDITKKESSQVTIQSKSIKTHEKYDLNLFGNDLSIIELEKPVSFNKNIQPVKLPSKRDVANTYSGKFARVSGWGVTNGTVQDLSPVLRSVENKILENSECQKFFDGIDIDAGIICLSGVDNKSSCSGDSGGPLTTVDDGTLIGITSFNRLFCPDGIASAFARVTNYLEWIEENSDINLV